MTICRTWFRSSDKIPEEAVREIKIAKKNALDKGIVYDEDSPKLSTEQLRKMVDARKDRMENPSNRVVRNVKFCSPK